MTMDTTSNIWVKHEVGDMAVLPEVQAFGFIKSNTVFMTAYLFRLSMEIIAVIGFNIPMDWQWINGLVGHRAATNLDYG